MPAEDDILLLQLIKQDDEKAFKHLSILICFTLPLHVPLSERQAGDRRTGPFHLYEFVGG